MTDTIRNEIKVDKTALSSIMDLPPGATDADARWQSG